MANYYPQQQPYAAQGPAQNLQFYPSSYPVSGHTTPSQASYGGFGGAPNPAPAYPVGGGGGGYAGFGSPAAGVSGRMGDAGGLRTGWLAAFGTEGYDGEPPLLEELGINFEHIRTKVPSTPTPKWYNAELELMIIDSNRVKPLRAHRPTPHGRQRPLWRYPLHSPLRHLPPPLRKSLLRLHLRRRRLRYSRPAPHPQSHVSSA